MKYIILFFLSITTLWAQDTTSTKKNYYKMWIKPSLSINYLSIDIEDEPLNPALKNKSLLPNYPLTVGLGFGIHNTYINLDYAQSVAPLRNESKYGKTRYFDFQLHSFVSQKILLDFYYQSYKGFYYEEGKNNIQILADTRIQQIGSEMLYFFNLKNFSVKNIFNPDGDPLQPTFTWYAGAGVYYHKVAIPAISLDEDTFRHIQGGFSGGVSGGIEILPRLTFTALAGMGFYFGGEVNPLSKMKFNQYVNFRLNTSLSYTQKDWSLAFSILYNNKNLYFKDVDLLGINTANFKLTYIKQIRFSTRRSNKVTRYLGM